MGAVLRGPAAGGGAIVRLLMVSIIVGLFALFPSAANAGYAAIVIDAKTGRVLHEVNADTRNYPASLTKMMTLYLVFGALKSGHLALNDRLSVSAKAARQPASRLGLRRGQTITVERAMLALVTKSANDVAVVIAEGMGGSLRNFALKMTAKAHLLGMSNTTFRNSSGLPRRGQMSTARDMATLARRLIYDYPSYYHYFSARSFSYGGNNYKNHNKLLATYNGADGIKTGYIRASGYNLVASAKRGGHRLIGVIFGGRSSKSRNRLMTRLLDNGFRKLNQTGVAKKASPRTIATSAATASNIKTAYNGKWAIQVGAYRQRSPAYKMAERVAGEFPSLLGDGLIKVVPLKKLHRRPLYRARIVGISKKQAYSACSRLKRKRVDCMEIRLKGVRVAYLRR